MNVTIIGTGYVGLTTGIALAYVGHQVTCVDKNTHIVETLKRGKATIHEPGLEELLERAKGHLRFQTDIPPLKGEGVVFIAVSTPTKQNGDAADMQYVDIAAKEVAERIQSGAKLVVVNKSTVPIGSSKHVQGIISRALTARSVQAEVWVASNPEFLAEGRAMHDTLYPDRVVIGADEGAPIGMLRELYGPFLEQTFPAPKETPRPERYPLPALITTTPTSAELTKYAANSFLATKISFINEFSRLAEHVGADITEVARAIGLDSRIGSKFLSAGIGWGGSCFGKDTRAIIATAKSYNYRMPIVESTIEVNKAQRLHVIDKLQAHLKVLRGNTVGLLGLAFKGNTDDLRDAQALTLIEHLHERGAVIKVHDPVAMSNAQRLFPDLPVEYCEDVVGLATGADALVVVTDWPEYTRLPLEAISAAMRGDQILDARNMLAPTAVAEAGLKYVGVGR